MSEINLNTNLPLQQKKQETPDAAETMGTIASATNTPSPLFNAVSASSETCGTIASSNSNSSSSSGGGTNIVC